MKINYSHLCRKGKKYPVCEDHIALPENNEKYQLKDLDFERKGHLFVLCDGMGGYHAGEVASELTANWLMVDYYQAKIEETKQEWFHQEITNLNGRIFKLAADHEQYNGMGTTLVSVLIKASKAYINNVGDSRFYLFSNSLKQITEDHSQVWELYKKGLITKEQIIKNKNKNIITEAIGVDPSTKINQYTIDLPEKYILLLCSDGLTDVMIDADIEKIIKKRKALEQTGEDLYKLALKKRTRDDVSIILISNYVTKE